MKIEVRPVHIGSITNDNGTAHKGTDTGYSALLESKGGRHHQFNVEHVKEDGGWISGTHRIFDQAVSFNEWPSFWNDTHATPWPSVSLDVPAKDRLSTELIARTNPSKPSFDAAQMIGELKDLPGMLRDIGKGFFKNGIFQTIGAANLSYRFGWLPFLKDMLSLTLFQDAVDKRFKTLQKLRDRGSSIRKVTLFDQTGSAEGFGVNDYWNCRLTTDERVKIWGYTIWTTSWNFPNTDADLKALARRAALGLSARPEVAWNLLPWSWLIDWFSNVGTYLEANNNTLGLNLAIARLCLTYERLRKATAESVTHDHGEHFHLTMEPMEHYVIRKQRFPADPPTITAWQPILNSGQLGILGSIIVTRR